MDYNIGLALVEKYKTELPTSDKDKYVADFKKATDWLKERQPEDFRLAASMAVDASKSLVNIAIAFFVATGGFIQWGITHDLTWRSYPILLLAAAAFLAVVSMLFGFNVIGTAFKRGEGRIATSTIPWSTEALKDNLRNQSFAGLGALILFALALISWSGVNPTGGLSVSPSPQSAKPSVRQLRIEGEWTRLKVRRGEMSVELDAPPPGSARTFDVELQ